MFARSISESFGDQTQMFALTKSSLLSTSYPWKVLRLEKEYKLTKQGEGQESVDDQPAFTEYSVRIVVCAAVTTAAR